MLTELAIKNFAIIDQQTIRFGPGLNVISGETGSGKSIVLNALELILGARPRAHFVREGADQLEIEAHFDLTQIDRNVIEELPDMARGDELLLSRTMNSQGKGKVYLNGRIATVALLEEIAQKLINICGQGQHVRLLDAIYHKDLVDEFAGNHELLSEYKKHYEEYRALAYQLEHAEESRLKIEQRRQYLQEVVDEILPLNLKEGIRLELERTVKRLESGEKLIAGTQAVLAELNQEEGLNARLSAVSTKIHELVRWDPTFKEKIEALQDIKDNVHLLERDLNSYLHKIEVDEESLNTLRDKLAEVARLERKYRTNDIGLLELFKKSKEELEALEVDTGDSEKRRKLKTLHEKVIKLAQKLSDSREKAGAKLIKMVEEDLKDLNMSEARLRLEMEVCEPNASGQDKLELLLSANRGESFKPLRHIASGGELSRIMLALKKNLRDCSGVNILVFDEVDSGISGSVARAVGQKLKSLSEFSQVICITHLPQVASLADCHLLVDKKVGKRTTSIIRVIEGDEKIEEIARMLAGYQITNASRESARELLSSKK